MVNIGSVAPVFTGTYQFGRMHLYGRIVESSGDFTIPNTTVKSPWAATFVPDKAFFENNGIFKKLWFIFGGVWDGHQLFGLDLPSVHVTLKGDFIWSGNVFNRKGSLDSDFIGSEFPTGNWVPGGTFESWCFLDPERLEPDVIESIRNISKKGFDLSGMVTGARAPVNINTEGIEGLRGRLGLNRVVAEAVVKYRKTKKFKTNSDFMKVSGIGEETFKRILGLISTYDLPWDKDE
jgi:competence ComEA-like helix-hairpin-helix protein